MTYRDSMLIISGIFMGATAALVGISFAGFPL